MLYVKGGSPSTVYDGQAYLEGSETTGAINTGGTILFGGHDGAAARTWGSIRTLKEDGTSGNYGSYMAFLTRPNGSAPTEKLRIDSSGRVLIGTTNNSNGHIAASNLAVQGADLSIFKDSGGDNAGVSGHKLKFVTQSGSLGEIDVLSEGGGGPSGRGGSMRFYTKANNTPSATERLRIDSNGHVLPATNNTYDLGSTSLGWRNVYMNDLNLSNMKGNTNDVDGTQGSWTIQEGKDDLYIINRLNGKKFKIKMEEIS